MINTAAVSWSLQNYYYQVSMRQNYPGRKFQYSPDCTCIDCHEHHRRVTWLNRKFSQC